MGKSKRKANAKPVAKELTDFDRLEISELTYVERLELFERALEHQAKRGLITPEQYKQYLSEISVMIAESMEN